MVKTDPMILTGREILTLTILILVGAIGGGLSVKKFGRWEIIRHLMQGAAGALIIVTLPLVDPSIVGNLLESNEPVVQFIKLFALALIGGYAGGSLLESSASQYAKRLGEVEEITSALGKENQRLSEDTKRLEETDKRLEEADKRLERQAKKSLEAVNRAEEILRGLRLSPSDIQAFREALHEVQISTLQDIAYRADDDRRQNWEHHKEALDRSLLVLKALISVRNDRPESGTPHWWYGSVGYCFKDKIAPDFEGALKYLNKAIELRGLKSSSGAYEFNRAICNIQLATEPKNDLDRSKLDQQIREDLDVAGKFPRWSQLIKTNTSIRDWRRQVDERIKSGNALPLRSSGA